MLPLVVAGRPRSGRSGDWLWTSCKNEAVVKKIDETKKVTASAVGPTADA